MQNYLTFDFLLRYFLILILEVLNFKGPLNTSFTLIFGRLPNNTRLVYLNMDFLIDGQISSFCPDQSEAEG